MNKRTAQILDDCLDRAFSARRPGAGLEECLSEYPDMRVELEPLVKVALYTREIFSPVAPSLEFSERALTNILRRAEQLRAGAKKEAFPPVMAWIEGLGRLIFKRRVWATALSFLLALLLAGGTVGASLNASPSDVLYPVKLTTEQAQVKLTADPERKAQLYMKFAGRRVEEMAHMAIEGRPEDIGKLEERLGVNLENVKAISEELQTQPSKARQAQKLQDDLIENASGHITNLRRTIVLAPEQSGKSLQIVIDRTLIGYTTPPVKAPAPGQKEERPEAREKPPEGRAVPGGPDSGGSRWRIRKK